MAITAKEFVRELLRQHGPLSVSEIVQAMSTAGSVVTRNPKQTVRNALTNDDLCQATGDGRYVYLPTFMHQAHMRIPMQDAVLEGGILRAPGEVAAFLWPHQDYTVQQQATFYLAGDLPIVIEHERWRAREPGMLGALSTYLRPPSPFWTWWQTQEQQGADTLTIECVDAETRDYIASAVQSTALDTDLIAERNAHVKTVAQDLLRRSQRTYLADLARRLLAHGIYHDEPPDPLIRVLFDPPGQIVLERAYELTFRPEMTPALRRLFATRLIDEEESELGRPLQKMLGLTQSSQQPPQLARRPSPADHTPIMYRIKVSLAWMKRVSCIIEILDDQTLEDLHDTIQQAFHWGNDHLYAFYMSNRRHDGLTAITRATEFDHDPPHAHEVILSDLDLKPRQHFLYIFDFGDNLEHDIEVMHIVNTPAPGNYPRIVRQEGEAPPQYPNLEDQEEE